VDVVSRIAELAARQHGLVGLHQLAELGVTRAVRRRLVTEGWLVAEAPRVLAVAGSPTSWHRRLQAGLLSLGGTAVVSHRAAAALHGLDRATRTVEFTIGRAGTGRRSPFDVHTTRHVDASDRVVVAGFAVTSASRTIIDLARERVSTVVLEASIDSAVRLGLSSPLVLARRLADLRGPGRWGCRRIDDLLLDSGGHTKLEREFLKLMRTASLPRPLTQVVHRHGGRSVARVDFLFEPYPLVVEVNGRHGHASDAERAKDGQRRNELQALGREVYDYTWNDVIMRGAHVVQEIRTCLLRLGWRR
jgi:very-short-patch-repair endonuclease